jgi:hypothetical protein
MKELTLQSVHATMAYKGITGIVPLILNFSTRLKWVVNFTLRPLYPGERTAVSAE